MPCYRKQPYKAGSECNVYLHTQQISINTGISLTKIPTKSHSKHRRQLSNFPCVRSPLSEPKTRRVKRVKRSRGQLRPVLSSGAHTPPPLNHQSVRCSPQYTVYCPGSSGGPVGSTRFQWGQSRSTPTSTPPLAYPGSICPN